MAVLPEATVEHTSDLFRKNENSCSLLHTASHVLRQKILS
jgi:hypothetical protein